MPPPRRARPSAPAAAALALAAACGLSGCGSSPRTAAPDPAPASSRSTDAPVPGPERNSPDEAAPPGARHVGMPDGGPTGSAADGGTGETPGRPRFEVRDAESTCSEDEQCVLTRYPGCCCSTTDSAMPRPFAISKPDLEARKQWCDSRVERIDCDVSRCPPPAAEQPEPRARTVACVDGLCVSRTAEP